LIILVKNILVVLLSCPHLPYKNRGSLPLKANRDKDELPEISPDDEPTTEIF